MYAIKKQKSVRWMRQELVQDWNRHNEQVARAARAMFTALSFVLFVTLKGMLVVLKSLRLLLSKPKLSLQLDPARPPEVIELPQHTRYHDLWPRL